MHILRFQAFSRFPTFFWPFNSMQSGPTSRPAVSGAVPGGPSMTGGPSANGGPSATTSVGSAGSIAGSVPVLLDDDETKKQK